MPRLRTTRAPCVAWILSCALLALATGRAAVGAERVVISTGEDGGSYFHIGGRLRTELVVHKQPPPEIQTSHGSLDNLRRLADPANSVNLALTQADALRSFLRERSDFRDAFFVLGDMGRECALLVTRREGGFASADALKRGGGGSLSLHAHGSGAAVTYAAMTALDPAYGSTPTTFEPALEALLQLQSAGEFTQLAGVLLMQRPTQLSPPLRIVLQNPETFALVPFRPEDLPNATLPDGSPIYSFETVHLGGTGGLPSMQVETFCTRALLIGSRSKLDRGVRDALAQILFERRDAIAGNAGPSE